MHESICLFLLSLFVFERERERERDREREREHVQQRGGVERERETQNLKRICADSREPDVGLEPANWEIMT